MLRVKTENGLDLSPWPWKKHVGPAPQNMLNSASSRLVQKKIGLAQNFAFTKKSAISLQSEWDLVKMINSWVGKIARISASLDKNCEFFTDG